MRMCQKVLNVTKEFTIIQTGKAPLQVTAQHVATPENSPKAIATSSALKGIQTLPAVASSEVEPLPVIPALTGVRGTPENFTSTRKTPRNYQI